VPWQATDRLGGSHFQQADLFLSDECRSWVKDGLAIQPQRGPLSAVTPISDKPERSLYVRKMPLATDAPQQTASLFDRTLRNAVDLV